MSLKQDGNYGPENNRFIFLIQAKNCTKKTSGEAFTIDTKMIRVDL